MEKGFKCQNCGYFVKTTGNIGTKNRNHCSKCLYSKHVDEKKTGDRASRCHSLMKPIGLTFKKTGVDKYGKPIQGEIMLVHECTHCKIISINRIAADDDSEMVLNIFEKSLEKRKKKLPKITFLKKEDRVEVKKQLFGK